jgi:hypothetical protein
MNSDQLHRTSSPERRAKFALRGGPENSTLRGSLKILEL